MSLWFTPNLEKVGGAGLRALRLWWHRLPACAAAPARCRCHQNFSRLILREKGRVVRRARPWYLNAATAVVPARAAYFFRMNRAANSRVPEIGGGQGQNPVLHLLKEPLAHDAAIKLRSCLWEKIISSPISSTIRAAWALNSGGSVSARTGTAIRASRQTNLRSPANGRDRSQNSRVRPLSRVWRSSKRGEFIAPDQGNLSFFSFYSLRFNPAIN